MSFETYVTEFEGKWWYWDETWDLCGPFDTEEEAETSHKKYVDEVLGR